MAEALLQRMSWSAGVNYAPATSVNRYLPSRSAPDDTIGTQKLGCAGSEAFGAYEVANRGGLLMALRLSPIGRVASPKRIVICLTGTCWSQEWKPWRPGRLHILASAPRRPRRVRAPYLRSEPLRS